MSKHGLIESRPFYKVVLDQIKRA